MNKHQTGASGESSMEGNMQSDFLWKTVGGVLDDACGTTRGRDLVAIGKITDYR